MKYVSIVMVLLIVGCSNPTVITINRTINHTIYITNTTIEPCNTTCPDTEINTTIYSRDYVLGLIRQLDFHENQQSLYFNDSECNWELNKSNNELEECEEELCEFNSSWCN